MATETRDEISLNDLQAVMDAVILLRNYGLVSADKVRKVRVAVHEDCNIHLERHGHVEEIVFAIDPIWRRTRPL